MYERKCPWTRHEDSLFEAQRDAYFVMSDSVQHTQSLSHVDKVDRAVQVDKGLAVAGSLARKTEVRLGMS